VLREGEWSLEEACEHFVIAHGNTWTAKTATQHRASLELFKQFAGAGTPLSEIDRRIVGDFKTLIEKLPITHGKRAADRCRSLQEIVDDTEKAGAPHRLGAKTVKRHLSSLVGLFRYAKEHGRYEGDNPATGFRFPRTRRPRDERPGWTPKHEALLRSPIGRDASRDGKGTFRDRR
jgi:integrase